MNASTLKTRFIDYVVKNVGQDEYENLKHDIQQIALIAVDNGYLSGDIYPTTIAMRGAILLILSDMGLKYKLHTTKDDCPERIEFFGWI